MKASKQEEKRAKASEKQLWLLPKWKPSNLNPVQQELPIAQAALITTDPHQQSSA
jgi:hypothetical protein